MISQIFGMIMPITTLQISNFRNLTSVSISPSLTGFNFICGENGSGKTNLLEAIHYLNLGRSFKNTSFPHLINHSAKHFSLSANILANTPRHIHLKIERSIDGAQQLRIDDNKKPNLAELTSLLPVRIIHSQSLQLFDSGPLF